MSIISAGGAVVGAGGVDAGYQISRSLRFNSADSAYLNRTPASAGNRKTWTWSGWVKLSGLGTQRALFSVSDPGNESDANFLKIDFSTGDLLQVSNYSGDLRRTTQVFRDVGAWYHIVVALDTTQATANNRIKVYVNGSQVTAFDATTNPNQNDDLGINATNAHNIGRVNIGGGFYLNGYLTEINFIDGSALDPTSFGEFNTDTGVWQPKKYTGSYGTNGFYLNFSDNASTTTLGDDLSGNGNDWTTNNFSVTAGAGNDSLVDTPTNYGTDTGVGGEVRGNYATLNPLGNPVLSGMTFSNGNLTVTTSSARQHIIGTMSLPTTGKWYWECQKGNSITGYQAAGIALINTKITSSPSYNYPYNVWGYNDIGWKIENGVQTTGYTSSASTSDIWGFAFDAGAGTLACYLNNTLLFTISSLTSEYIPYLGTETGCTPSINFGQRPFAYTAPSGFLSLCTQNLPEPTIADGGDYFDVVIDTGANIKSASEAVYTHQWAWIKDMDNVNNHQLIDSVRGTSAVLQSNTTAAETTYSTPSGESVAWVWSAPNTGVSNTAGTISSTVSVSTTSGFSIVTYTGTGSAATIGHGLGAVPRMIIVKNRDAADAWQVYHAANTANPETDYLVLNTNAATADAADRWNDTLPTSTVFSIGNGVEVNTNTEDYVAYVFAAIPGYSAFGSYTGNGSADGPFVYTGFRPSFVLTKRTDTTGNWRIYDYARSSYNVADLTLSPNASDAEVQTANTIDMLSNGFKLKSSSTDTNASGGTYIYAAFAENPYKVALAR